jgi:Fe-S oxidoreductase
MNTSARVKSCRRITDPAHVIDIWSIREQGASATSISLDPTQPDPIVGWEDTAVDPYQLGDYLREFQALVDRYGYSTSLYGHFGDGCIHARITFDTRTTEGVAKWRQFSHDIAHLVVKFGGSLSGEHGDGQAKAEFLPIMFGENLMQAFREFKHAWDPEGRMNPGKLIDAYKMDENLRFGPDYVRPVTSTTLAFVEDLDGFARSSERCIGMGKCRAQSGAMCPSYQASNEERYSTRGRAHLLHEMLRGEVIQDGWENEEIANSLEHCLSCKACKHECPTQVDIASYKAEFMSAHYKKRKRPLHQYIFGHIGNALPKLSRFPRIVNFLQSGICGSLAKSVLGISSDKKLPPLSTKSFSQWANDHADESDTNFSWFGHSEHPPVVLWSDSVNNHYRPDVLISAVNVLKLAGFRVAVARSQFCCGRPLYEYGFLDQARRQLTAIVDELYPHLPLTAKVVVLEPSCLSVFKDELKRFFANEEKAVDLESRAMTISAFLGSEKITPKKTLGKGILHLHCHDKASAETHEREWMQQCFSELSEPESGCCGMAGTFGMRKQTRTLGQTLFNRKLKPALDSSESDVIVVANGFSCNEQFADNSNRQVLHPVQVIEKCL